MHLNILRINDMPGVPGRGCTATAPGAVHVGAQARCCSGPNCAGGFHVCCIDGFSCMPAMLHTAIRARAWGRLTWQRRHRCCITSWLPRQRRHCNGSCRGSGLAAITIAVAAAGVYPHMAAHVHACAGSFSSYCGVLHDMHGSGAHPAAACVHVRVTCLCTRSKTRIVSIQQVPVPNRAW